MFALVDCNACYASCEQIFRPDLRGQPVVVLSNNDGCVVARNNEAKALGIPAIAPYFKVQHLLQQHQVHVFSSNYELYGDISRRVMNTLARFTPHLEIYSIDEAFLDLAGIRDLREHGLAIKTTVWREQRMPVCVGIAPTKTLAKLANYIAKRSRKLGGVCVIKELAQWRPLFERIPVDEVWGVGAKLANRLQDQGIYTVADLQQQDPNYIQREYSVVLARTVSELKGKDCIPLESQPVPRQEIFRSRSFGQKITEQADLLEAISSYAAKAAAALRRQQSLTQCVYITVQTSRYAQHPYYNSSTQALGHPTNDTRVITQAAIAAAKRLFIEGYAYNKAGVGLLELSHSAQTQGDLFGHSQPLASKALMEVLDAANNKYGHNALFLAREATEQKWQMARRFKSPAYTTRISEVPVVRL